LLVPQAFGIAASNSKCFTSRFTTAFLALTQGSTRVPRQRNTGWLQMSLVTGGENRAWLLGYDRHANVGAASVGMQFQF
jgi:hypothetical protein